MTKKKFADNVWERNANGQLNMSLANRQQIRNLLNETGPGFCLAKWSQVTMHLGNGLTHSCHHPGAHKIPLEELAENPGALHNTKYKKYQRKLMLSGQRPSECDFCWRVEDNNEFSDRVLKSLSEFSSDYYDQIVNYTGEEDHYPAYVEVSFGRTCNFACSYCGPAFSSKWEQDISKSGPYKVIYQEYNAVQESEKHYNNNEHNPYIEAFWRWFPDAYKHMQVFRITGGEPLLIKDTFRVMDFLLANPNPNLELAINSNACPPGDIWETFVKKVKRLVENNCVKKFDLYTSAEATGERAEYIRDGMDWNMFTKNIEYFLTETRNTRVVIMSTFNILSASTYQELLTWILDLKRRYSYHGLFKWFEDLGFSRHEQGELPYQDRVVPGSNAVHSRVGVDIPYLRHPAFLDVAMCTHEQINDYLIPALDFMYSNLSSAEYFGTSRFEDYECMKLKRNVSDCINKSVQVYPDGTHQNKTIAYARAQFYKFVEEYDRRRKKDFLKTFPEYTGFYDLCRIEHEKLFPVQHRTIIEKVKQDDQVQNTLAVEQTVGPDASDSDTNV